MVPLRSKALEPVLVLVHNMALELALGMVPELVLDSMALVPVHSRSYALPYELLCVQRALRAGERTIRRCSLELHHRSVVVGKALVQVVGTEQVPAVGTALVQVHHNLLFSRVDVLVDHLHNRDRQTTYHHIHQTQLELGCLRPLEQFLQSPRR